MEGRDRAEGLNDMREDFVAIAAREIEGSEGVAVKEEGLYVLRPLAFTAVDVVFVGVADVERFDLTGVDEERHHALKEVAGDGEAAEVELTEVFGRDRLQRRDEDARSSGVR